ncbi:hypothetical protein KSP39_PZI021970 [Platanthera zijinensis]|uniref:Uncharacterized protein n=1 Tax=Platanthera zijinensis TaxID=2320716 RepID=A0AAP0FWM4_9ASPA
MRKILYQLYDETKDNELNFEELSKSERYRNMTFYYKIQISVINDALKKVKNGKGGWVRRYTHRSMKMSRELKNFVAYMFFNKILKSKNMSDQCRKNILISLYNNKSDTQSCVNYREIKLMSHTLKL